MKTIFFIAAAIFFIATGSFINFLLGMGLLILFLIIVGSIAIIRQEAKEARDEVPPECR